jgi:serine/threonine protein kinase
MQGLETLHHMRICHKDLSPENFMLLENRSLVIDFAMCLRIPYAADGRHLITRRTVRNTVTISKLYLLPILSHAPIVISGLWKTGTFNFLSYFLHSC